MRSYNVLLNSNGASCRFRLNNGASFLYGLTSDAHGLVAAIDTALDHLVRIDIVDENGNFLTQLESAPGFVPVFGSSSTVVNGWTFVQRAGSGFKEIYSQLSSETYISITAFALTVYPLSFDCQVKFFFDSI